MDPCRIRLDPRSSGITFSSNEFRFQPGTGGSGGDKGPPNWASMLPFIGLNCIKYVHPSGSAFIFNTR